ncbi:LacI family DNA-binding transcriptional regulator [Rouxiella sp. T17]|uniref:LacI family DNA-binding transcriptional regulator n=1 Tax=Rouxiella sp. T17 TaxID=3085684 RepID=UPI002FCBD54C
MTKDSTAAKQLKATASDVAKRAGVSKWTVSRAFTPGASVSDKAQKKVLAAAAELGYRPNLLARSLTKKSTHIVGVAIDELKNPHSMKMLDAATKELQARGYMALLLNITEGENYQAVMAMADQLQVDGILFLGNILTDELFAVAHTMHHIPFVQVCRNNSDEREIEVVNVDGFNAGREIAALLLAEGYQRFGYLKGPDSETSQLMRLEGYCERLNEAGFQLETLLIAGHYDRKLAYDTLLNYLQTTPPEERVEAMFCENDILALGALEALRSLDMQHSMAIVGFDDIDEADSATWQLTTFSQQLGKLMTEALNRLIDNEIDEQGDWRKGELKVRRSHLKSS